MRKYPAHLWAGIAVAIPLFVRSEEVWRDCGYECGIFGSRSSLTAMVGVCLAMLVAMVCAIFLIMYRARYR